MVFNEYQFTGEYTTRDSLILPSSDHARSINHITGVPDPIERRAPIPTREAQNPQDASTTMQVLGNVAMPTDVQQAYRQL